MIRGTNGGRWAVACVCLVAGAGVVWWGFRGAGAGPSGAAAERVEAGPARVRGGPAGEKRASVEALVRQFKESLGRSGAERSGAGHSAVFRELFGLDARRALQLLQKEPDYDVRNELVLGVLKHATLAQIDEVLAAAARLSATKDLVGVYYHAIAAALKLDPTAGIAMWERLPDSNAKSDALMNVVGSWPDGRSLEPLVGMYGRLEFAEDKESFAHGFQALLRGYGGDELKALAGLKPMPERIGRLVEDAWARTLSAGIPATDLVGSQGAAAGLSPAVRFSALQEAVDKRPEEVAEALLAGGAGRDLDVHGPRLVSALVGSDPGKAAAWVERLPAGPVADQLAFQLVESWLKEDPRSASAYALEPSSPRLREVAALAVRDYLKGRGDDEGAAKWAAQVTSEDLRERLGTDGAR